jgi:hypothetical protein
VPGTALPSQSEQKQKSNIMSLQPIPVTTDELAKNVARQILQQIKSVRDNVNKLRTEGVPARPAVPERELPDGRIIPATPAVPAITADAINAALGTANCELLDEMRDALSA